MATDTSNPQLFKDLERSTVFEICAGMKLLKVSPNQAFSFTRSKLVIVQPYCGCTPVGQIADLVK